MRAIRYLISDSDIKKFTVLETSNNPSCVGALVTLASSLNNLGYRMFVFIGGFRLHQGS